MTQDELDYTECTLSVQSLEWSPPKSSGIGMSLGEFLAHSIFIGRVERSVNMIFEPHLEQWVILGKTKRYWFSRRLNNREE